MSLLALGAVLEGRHDYRIVDGNLEADPLATLDQAIKESGVDILGVTVMPGPQLENAVPVCRTLKARHPDLTIVWGGYFPTQHYATRPPARSSPTPSPPSPTRSACPTFPTNAWT
jgi:methylmalonyl-CoA mutase cobalamin-binding subunit